MKMSLPLRAFGAISILPFVLAACGGGGSDNQVETATVTISGAAVKGPLANATVKLYQVDYTARDLMGVLIDDGETGSNASITGLEIPADLTGRVILEFIADGDTVEINTGLAPIFERLLTVVDVQRLYDGDAIYASPLTTMAFNLAKDNADESTPFSGDGDGSISETEFTVALDVAKRLVTRSFGFGLPDSVDIFSVPPMLTDSTISNEQFTEVASYRQAIEAVSAITVLLSDDSDSADEPVDMLNAIVSDLSDGNINGVGKNGNVSELETLTKTINQQLEELDVNTLQIPGTTDLIGDIEKTLVEETGVSGVTANTKALEDGSVNVTPSEPETEPDLSEPSPATPVDTDEDGIRDDLDLDDDNDGVADSDDAFPLDDTETLDTDNDGIGNNADSDDDNDGVEDTLDAFPLDNAETLDTDGDGIGNNTDPDDDNDGVEDSQDVFPLDDSEFLDNDNDGIGNNADPDDDNDGVEDTLDAFPLNNTETVDTDNDGIGNNADPDDDNDGVEDSQDVFPLDNSEFLDNDNDGIGNNADTDDDNDGVEDTLDAFPLNNTESVDTDGDGIGNNADPDDDNDGVEDTLDAFPLDHTETLDTDGDGIGNNADTNDDNDSELDVNDAFPLDDSETMDTDNDGIGNNADLDDDNDGVNDADDAFPLNSTEQYDTDGDGIGNNSDPTPYPTLTWLLNGDQLIGLTNTLDNPATVSSGTNSISYSSSDTSIATIDESGTVTAVSAGAVTITAELTGFPSENVTYELTIANSTMILFNNGQAASVVLGQPDFTTSDSWTSQSGIDFPDGNADVVNGMLYLPDTYNQRMLGFLDIPSTNGADADFVVGANDFTSAGNIGAQAITHSDSQLFVSDYDTDTIAVYNSMPTSNQAPAFTLTATGVGGLNSVEAMSFGDGKLVVADSNQNRVLIWNSEPTSDTAPDLVIGQADFSSTTNNRGSSVAANTLWYPSGVWTDGTRLVVADKTNHRVLIWNTFPTTNGQSADLVLGQTDFVSNAANQGGGAVPTASTLRYVSGVYALDEQLFVADSLNYRVLVWNIWPTTNGQAADRVLGQDDFITAINDWGEFKVGRPTGITAYGTQLIVNDASNGRYLIFNGN